MDPKKLSNIVSGVKVNLVLMLGCTYRLSGSAAPNSTGLASFGTPWRTFFAWEGLTCTTNIAKPAL